MAKRGSRKTGRAAKKRAAPRRRTARKPARGRKTARKAARPMKTQRKRARKTTQPKRAPRGGPGAPGRGEGALEGEVLPGGEEDTGRLQFP
jgi:hypothetical protein